MKIATDWQQYKVLATGDGEKLEKWGKHILLRPDPQVIWHKKKDFFKVAKVDAHYHRSESGGGHWQYFSNLPEAWQIDYKDLTFSVKPMGFKHTGLFPEQAVNWDVMRQLIAQNPNVSVLNLFGYTGAATVACAKQGAYVTHVDSAKNMVERCKLNAKLSGVEEDKIRYIVDDCRKFVKREIKRGKFYDAVLLDPPSYGRGSNGEIWKLENDLYDFVELVKQVLVEKPLFVLINSYTTGLQPTVMRNVLARIFGQGDIEAYEVCLPTEEKDVFLPCGASAIYKGRTK
ncbi:MAG: class I SAM-dependent methyltransferase [Clostridia bacterium]|nr:class I SAM-dependent methyltransferase [Clostridia bacterium]